MDERRDGEKKLRRKTGRTEGGSSEVDGSMGTLSRLPTQRGRNYILGVGLGFTLNLPRIMEPVEITTGHWTVVSSLVASGQ